MKKETKNHLAYIIPIAAIIVALSIIGIVLLCVFMPNDSDWAPFENIKVGIYTTQDNCTDVFGSSDEVEIEIRKTNAADIDGKAALAMISDSLMLNIYVGGEKADIQIIGTHYEYYTDIVRFSFMFTVKNTTRKVFCESVCVAAGQPRNALSFCLQEGNNVVFKRENNHD